MDGVDDVVGDAQGGGVAVQWRWRRGAVAGGASRRSQHSPDRIRVVGGFWRAR